MAIFRPYFRLISLVILMHSAAFAQDTLRYMSYNILNYGLPYSTCSEANNNVSVKDLHLRTVFSYVQPDILAVCEMISQSSNAQRLLDSVINFVGPMTFAKAAMTSFSGGDLANMIYYDPGKMVLQSQDAVITSLRDINLYHFYLLTPDLPVTHDTVHFTAIIAHLKAGSGSSNEQERAQMTSTLMNYLYAQGDQGNKVLSGDFNLYSSFEQAYQNLINFNNPTYRFFDPLNLPGDWNSNSLFSGIHTQSTHLNSNGCAAGGGLDDRFDFILESKSLLDGSDGLLGLSSTYHALGQDSMHFNQSVNSPPQNLAVPVNVADALYGISDHLPVIMDFITTGPEGYPDYTRDHFMVMVKNPVHDVIEITLTGAGRPLKVELFHSGGTQVMKPLTTEIDQKTLKINVNTLKPGLYFLRFSDEQGNQVTRKVVIL